MTSPHCPAPTASPRHPWHAARRLGYLLAAALALACARGEGDAPTTEGWVEIRGQRISVELADDADEQALGLGERDALPWDHGMYFIYEQPGFYAFWMKGMRFSIDIVWIRDGRISEIAPNVPFEPGRNGPTLRPSSLADAVLEVPAGYAAAHGWRIGDRVVFERLSSG